MDIDLRPCDCLSPEGLPSLADNSVDLILTDIPYGEVNQESNGLRILDRCEADRLRFDLDTFLQQCERVCRGSFYIFCGFEQVSHIAAFFRSKGMSRRITPWEKTNPSPMNGQSLWLSGVELCVYAKKPRATFNGFCRSPVLKYPCGSSKRHPDEKPLKLFEDLVLTSSNPGDLVLDPCLGSGTTAEACHILGRNCIGFEVNADYLEIAKDRLRQQRLVF